MDTFQMSLFQDPPTPCHVVFAWYWNSRITEEMIDRELDEMLDMGIRGVYVIPLPEDLLPGKMYTALHPGCLTDAFMRLIRYAAKAALQRDMAFWLYDEAGWPSGCAGHRITALQPDLTRITVAEQGFTLPAGTAYRQCENVLAAFCQGKRVLPGGKFAEDLEVTEYRLHYHAGTGLTDIMDRRTTNLFIRETHERYAQALQGMAGKNVRYVFTDEPNTGDFPWCDGFERLFEDRYRYSVLPYLPAILHPEQYPDEESVQTRIDYRRLCGELFRTNYLDPIRAWCAAHGMFSTGHLGGEDTTTAGRKNGYGSVLASLRHLDMPGVDLIWRQLKTPDMTAQTGASEIPFFPRIAPSAARQTGGNLSVSESFNIFGSGLTWNQIRFLVNCQYVRGINVLNGMGISSGREKGLALTMRPFYTPEVPGVTHMRALNEAFARTQYLMRLGDPAGDAALYTPDDDFLADGQIAEAAAESFRELGISLEKQGLDFDYIDDEAIRNAVLQDGALHIGKAVYRKVFVPECRYMPSDVRNKLASMADLTPRPVLNCDCPDIRARKRILPDGSVLYFAVLEREETAEVRFRFDETLPGFRLFVEDGSAVALKGPETAVSLAGGQSCAFLFTKAPVTDNGKAYSTVARGEVTRWEAAVRSAFRIDGMGIRKDEFPLDFLPTALGGWDRNFSGEWVYRFSLDSEFLPVKPLPGDRFRLKLGKVCYSARVWVNGREAGIAAVSPYEVCFPASSGEMIVEIEVANTPANEILHTDAFVQWPGNYLQPMYHNRSAEYERESADGGLYGPVEWILERQV